MTSNIAHLQVVLEAAQRLLAAREDDMITADEWEALANAVDQCNSASAPSADGTSRSDTDTNQTS